MDACLFVLNKRNVIIAINKIFLLITKKHELLNANKKTIAIN